MLRLRRYRIFLVFAVFAVFFLYQFSNVPKWDPSSKISVDTLRKFGQDNGLENKQNAAPAEDKTAPKTLQSVNFVEPPSPSKAEAKSIEATAKKSPITSPTAHATTSQTGQAAASESPLAKPDTFIPPPKFEDEDFAQTGQGRLEVEDIENAPARLHWQKQEENFPVPSGSLIILPTGTPKKIPKIQYAFKEESADTKSDRLRKRASVKEAFQTSWTSYREYAWMHDELSPVSGSFRNPFCGWAATMVDSLDTLWIMGLKEEFEIAVNAVQSIDFTVSLRKDIPLFETVIRYLGGLVAAYDLSGGKYKMLLEKAVELAEILMGAFDTPNRMPQTFYQWAPAYASQPHRANARVVLAELGSLSVEFTRLAQITKEMKYYDAVARITDELEKWQNNTKLPGMWPTAVDASGCKKPERNAAQVEHSKLNGPQEPLPRLPAQAIPDGQPLDEPSSSDAQLQGKTETIHNVEEVPDVSDRGFSKGNVKKVDVSADPIVKSDPIRERDTASDANALRRRQLEDSTMKKVAGAAQADAASPKAGISTELEKADCEIQGLASPPYGSMETFTLGGQSDSTYEYLPKQYMLLGGLQDQYRSMYENAMDTARKYLLYRPMTQNQRNVLASGKVRTKGHPDATDEIESDLLTTYESTHLTCFAGGMFAVGARIFGIEGDMDIAKKLTDGCVWAYESTPTGIMPEIFEVVPCASMKTCEWNETLWWEYLDRHRKYREQAWANAVAKTPTATGMPKVASGENTQYKDDPNRISTEKFTTEKGRGSSTGEGASDTKAGRQPLIKRQGDSSTSGSEKAEPVVETSIESDVPVHEEPSKTSTEELRSDEEPATNVKGGMPVEENKFPNPKSLFIPPRMPTHEEFVKARITEERIPSGFTEIGSRKYILRPEAIESVFVMWRVTGDEYWRDRGWKMFIAIQSYTRTPLANSAIQDVTSDVPSFLDEMESFWLAETLKYFYLLFSEPELISLDDYVLNTEAHPFKRPV